MTTERYVVKEIMVAMADYSTNISKGDTLVFYLTKNYCYSLIENAYLVGYQTIQGAIKFLRKIKKNIKNNRDNGFEHTLKIVKLVEDSNGRIYEEEVNGWKTMRKTIAILNERKEWK